MDFMKVYNEKERKLYEKYKDIKNKASIIVVDYIRKNTMMKDTIVHLLKNPKKTCVKHITYDEKFINNWVSDLGKAKTREECDKVLSAIGISVNTITFKFTPTAISSDKMLNTMISSIICEDDRIKMSGAMSLLDINDGLCTVINEEYVFKKNNLYPEELDIQQKDYLLSSMQTSPITVAIHLKYEDYNVSHLMSMHIVRCIQILINKI